MKLNDVKRAIFVSKEICYAQERGLKMQDKQISFRVKTLNSIIIRTFAPKLVVSEISD